MNRVGRSRATMVFVAALSLLIGVIGAWLWAGRVSAAQDEERDDLTLFLDASSAGWAEVTDQFFTVPEATAETIGAISQRTIGPNDLIALLADSIRSKPALDAAFLGFTDGSFIFVGRSDEVGADGFRTRVITTDNGTRDVQLTWTDAALNVGRSEAAPNDTYDPRERPWFTPIVAGNPRTWTDPYLFSSSQLPGITHSRAILDEQGDLAAVVGVDIRLDQMSEFLEKLRPGDRGEALVIDRLGQVIASSPMNASPSTLTAEGDGALPLEQSEDLRELVRSLVAGDAGDGAAMMGDGVRTTVTRPAGSNNSWYLAVRAFDDDFLGDVSTEPAKNLLGVAAVGFSSAVGTAILGYGALRYLGGLKSEADRDELTGLLGRRAAKRTIALTLARDESFWLAIVDLDHFKVVNDEHGHVVGDQVLAIVGSRLEQFALENDLTAGRLGGDEFVLCTEVESPWGLLNELLAAPIESEGNQFSLGASIGVARSQAGDGLSVDELLAKADRALYQAKHSGGGTFVLADSDTLSS